MTNNRWAVRCKQALPNVLVYAKTIPYGKKYFINYAVTFGVSKKKAEQMWNER